MGGQVCWVPLDLELERRGFNHRAASPASLRLFSIVIYPLPGHPPHISRQPGRRLCGSASVPLRILSQPETHHRAGGILCTSLCLPPALRPTKMAAMLDFTAAPRVLFW